MTYIITVRRGITYISKSYKDFDLIFIKKYKNFENFLHRKLEREKQSYRKGQWYEKDWRKYFRQSK
jgi:hypothetical protein